MADRGVVLHALMDLHKGDTNAAIRLLEIQLQGGAVAFASS